SGTEAELAAAPAIPVPPGPSPAVPLPRLRHLLQMTVGAEFLELLQRVRAALSHSHPGAGLEELLSECMRRALGELARRQRAQVARPRPGSAPSLPAVSKPRPRQISAAVRRAVWQRDAGRCSFIGTDGKQCGSTMRLELHHRVAVVEGGPSTVDNLCL